MAGESLTALARTNIASVSNAATSQFKVPSTTKKQKDDTLTANPEDLIQNEDVFLTEGFTKHPKVPESKVESADFYRFGNSSARSSAGSGNFNVGEIQAKRIDEFGEGDGRGQDSLASIRLLGPPTGKDKERQDLIPKYTKFILESVQEAHNERYQVVETFGEFFTFFYGERPPMYTFSGTLINTKFANWLQDFMFYYENFLRGTKCVEQRASIVLTYGGRQVEGFIVGTSNVTNAATDKGVQITFQVIIIDRKILALSADFGLTINDGVFAQDDSFIQLLTDAGLSRAEVSSAYTAVKETAEGEKPAADGNKLNSLDANSLAAEMGSQLGPIGPSASGGLQLL